MKSTIPETGVPITQSDRQEASLHGEILLRLRDYVVEGNIPEGARVPERQLCEMLGISRTPLREALKVLAAEGLIELLPNRGARVRQLSERDLEELFDVMAGPGKPRRTPCQRGHHGRGNRSDRAAAL
jgi:DNA-binding GntR family transcriptional regulator